MSKKILIVGHAGYGHQHSCVSTKIIEETLKQKNLVNLDYEVITPEQAKEMGVDFSKLPQLNEPPSLDYTLTMRPNQNDFSRPLSGKEKRRLRRKQNRKK